MDLANQVREARINNGLTQVQLAVAANVSPATIHRLETGLIDTRPATRAKLEAVLGVTLTREHVTAPR